MTTGGASNKNYAFKKLHEVTSLMEIMHDRIIDCVECNRIELISICML